MYILIIFGQQINWARRNVIWTLFRYFENIGQVIMSSMLLTQPLYSAISHSVKLMTNNVWNPEWYFYKIHNIAKGSVRHFNKTHFLQFFVCIIVLVYWFKMDDHYLFFSFKFVKFDYQILVPPVTKSWYSGYQIPCSSYQILLLQLSNPL